MSSASTAQFELWFRQNHPRDAVDWLKLLWRWRRVLPAQLLQKLGFRVETTAPLFWGGDMRVLTNEEVSKGLLTFGYAEVAITATMLRLLDPGQTVVDVGAHFGFESLLAATLVGPSGRVFAFEPHPNAHAIASKNLAGMPQVRLMQRAVGDRPATVRMQNRPVDRLAFNRVVAGADAGANTIEVEMTTLDTEFETRGFTVNFVKIDVEGFEEQVLAGATEVLRRDAPVVIFESDMPVDGGKMSPRGHVLVGILERHEYQCFYFDFDGRYRFGPIDSFAVHHANILAIPRRRLDATRKRLAGSEPYRA